MSGTTRNQVAGFLGHYGPGLVPRYKGKRIEANKLVDKYNKTVGNLPPEEQMEYQREIIKKINKIFQ